MNLSEDSPRPSVFPKRISEPSEGEMPRARQEMTNADAEDFSRINISLFRRQIQLLLVMALAAFGNGCVSMYKPDYEAAYRASARPLGLEEKMAREQKLGRLLQQPRNPKKGEANQEDRETQAWQSGIAQCQRNRIMRHCRYLLEEADANQFEDFIQTCRQARDLLGIQNFDRYPPDLLEEVLRNYESPERNRERQVVLAIMSREDHEGIGNLQALNVEAYRLQELSKSYKLILIESTKIAEILHHIRTLQEEGILREGVLKGVIIGSHGDEDSTEAGITKDTIYQLSSLNQFFRRENAYFIFGSCEAGLGADEEFNLANQAALTFSQVQVVACDGILTGIDFETDEKGRFRPESLRLESLSDMLTLGLLNNTYYAASNRQTRQALERYFLDNGKYGLSRAFIRDCLRAGLSSLSGMKKLHDHNSNAENNLSPEAFVQYVQLFPGTFEEAIEKKIPLERAESFVRLGIFKPHQIHLFLERNVQPEDIQRLLAYAKEHGVPDQYSQAQHLMVLAGMGISFRTILSFYHRKIFEGSQMISMMNSGVPFPEVAFHSQH